MNRVLSIFIDESGDFGSFRQHSPYYLVTMILHDQNINISENIKALDNHLHLREPDLVYRPHQALWTWVY